jgi:hypothetical protein
MHHRIGYVAAVVPLLLSACVTVNMTAAGAAVRLTSNPDVVRTCAYVGQVVGSDSMNGGLAGQRAAEENAMREMRNQAAASGANVVHLTLVSTGFSGSSVKGESYKCP